MVQAHIPRMGIGYYLLKAIPLVVENIIVTGNPMLPSITPNMKVTVPAISLLSYMIGSKPILATKSRD